MSKLILAEGAAPDTPSSGKMALYATTAGRPAIVDDTGAQRTLAGLEGTNTFTAANTFSAILTGARFRSGSVANLSDDTATSITPLAVTGIIMINSQTGGGEPGGSANADWLPRPGQFVGICPYHCAAKHGSADHNRRPNRNHRKRWILYGVRREYWHDIFRE